MNIGNKLQQARTNANMTQEQIAEALGVSRQTISNWENEKTYPDIRSVVTLSDLYNVSLDYLLKEREETSMTPYLNYLEESTNTVKSKNKLSKLILILTYLIIWSFSLIIFWFFTDGSDAMGYGIVHLWIIQPVTIFVISLLIALNNYWGHLKWLSTIIFGVMHMLSEYATFSTANMVTFGKLNAPDWPMIFVGAIISSIGLGIGVAIHYDKERSLVKYANYNKLQ